MLLSCMHLYPLICFANAKILHKFHVCNREETVCSASVCFVILLHEARINMDLMFDVNMQLIF
jgi:hypothetical protein